MDRFCRFIVRCYPRAWRVRYEDEMTVLLDESGASWRVIADLARGALREQGRYGWQWLTGCAEVGLTTGQRFWLAWIGAGVISIAGWIAGRGLEPIVPDALNGLHLLFALFVFTTVPRPAADTPPVYVVHPLKPERLLRLRAPFFWPRLPARWVVVVSTTCFVLFAIGQGAMASVPDDTSGGRSFSWWFWAISIPIHWATMFINWSNTPPAQTSS